MKWIGLLMCLLLVAPSVLGLNPEDFVLINVDNDDTVSFNVDIPQEVYESTLFEVLVVLDVDSTTGELDVQLSDAQNNLNYTRELVDFQGEQLFLLNWTTSIDEYTEFSLSYVNGEIASFALEPITKTIVDRQLQETTYFPQDITTNQKEYLITLLSENTEFEYALGQFIDDENRGVELVDLDKKVYVETLIYNDNSTTTRTVVVIDVMGADIITDLKIIETIPKDFAGHVDDISFNIAPIVLEEDPVVMWHLQGIEEERIEYFVNGNSSLTGNTIVLVASENETGISTPVAPARDIWIPILIIPLVAGIIIFFSKYAPKKKLKR